jgi:hypothetical protein
MVYGTSFSFFICVNLDMLFYEMLWTFADNDGVCVGGEKQSS